MILHYTAAILETTVPLIPNPSESFLACLEEALMKIVVKGGMTAVTKCVSCIAALVYKVTHNYTIVHDCFRRFYSESMIYIF